MAETTLLQIHHVYIRVVPGTPQFCYKETDIVVELHSMQLPAGMDPHVYYIHARAKIAGGCCYHSHGNASKTNFAINWASTPTSVTLPKMYMYVP